MMISCRELAELLIDYVAGDLAPEHHRRLEQHLHCCPPCLTYLETYQLTIQITRKLPCRPMPPELMEKLRAALKEIKDLSGSEP
jgi:anti-sigma factor RsiW